MPPMSADDIGGGNGFLSLNAAVKAFSAAPTSDGAQSLIVSIDQAIDDVSHARGNLGGLQNRLEHTWSALRVTEENLVASESRIRDADMAAEMVTLTKDAVLRQAGQAVLAQANQAPQGILRLLQPA